MTARDRAVGLAARAVVWGLRLMVLHLPRRLLALIFRGLARLVWVVTGSREAEQPVSELAGVFASGPPFTVTLEKMFRHMEAGLIASAARCLSRRSPYGEP